MSEILKRLKATTAALLRGGTAVEISLPSEAGAAVVEMVGHVEKPAPIAGTVISAGAEAGSGKKKDKAGRMPGDDGYDENDLADDEPEASALAADNKDLIAAAVAAEQARWSAVMASPELAGREELAKSMLGGTTLTADQIITQLKAAPKAQAAASVVAMLGHDNPDLGAGIAAKASDGNHGWDRAYANLPKYNAN